MLLSGTLFAPVNSGVSVNGRLAQIDGNGNFYVNALPLALGPNTISIVASAQDGQTATQTIIVTSSGPAAFSVAASPTDGLAPLVTMFRIEVRDGIAFGRVELDFDNDGTVDDAIPAGAFSDGAYELAVTYPAGKWNTVARVMDANGNVVFTSTTIVTAMAPLKLESKLRSVFTGMIDRLRVGNVGGALTAVTDVVYEKYSAVFAALQPALGSIVDQLGSLEEVTFDDGIAEYALVRDTPSGLQRFMIYLIRGADGIWRIEGM